MGTFFQNPGRARSDAEVWRQGLDLAGAAEPLGFDSVWSAEHHFTDYHMCPNVAQFLTWVAARTERVQLGSMVMVLPWHDPVRLVDDGAHHLRLHHRNGRATSMGLVGVNQLDPVHAGRLHLADICASFICRTRQVAGETWL